MISARLLLYDYNKPTKKGYPIKIRVTSKRKVKYINLHRYAQYDQWDKATNEPVNHPDPDILEFVLNKKVEIVRTVNYCNDHRLTLEESLKQFENTQAPGITYCEFFDRHITQIAAIGKSTNHFVDAKRKVMIYGDVPLNQVDYEYIQGFHRWALRDGMSNNGLHSYMRTMRTVFYEARRKGLVPFINPFAGNMPRLTRTPKLAADVEQLIKIKDCIDQYDPRTKLWLLMFYFGGMSFVDLSLLRWDQIHKGRIRYQRHKHGGSGVVIDLKIFPHAQAIIDELGDRKADRLFPFIPLITESKNKYNHWRQNFNKRYLRVLSQRLGLKRPLTTRSARHTFRTIGRHKGIDRDILRELMGHEENTVEDIYQDRFPEKERDQAHCQVITLNTAMEGRNPV